MSKAEITGVTVSVEFGFEQEYGKGTKSFANIQARYPEPNQIDSICDVMSDGLDMYFAAWRTLLASRYATGIIGGAEFKEALAATTARINKIRKYLKPTEENNGQQQ